MNRILLHIRYNGLPFYGWQTQIESQPSVQSAIEQALGQLFNQPISIMGGSRTDRHVHARGQLATTDIFPEKFTLEILRDKLNAMLWPHIHISWIRRVSPDFPLRKSIRSKVYHYYLIDNPALAPFVQGFASPVSHKIARSPLLHPYCKVFEGTHDFKNFANIGTPLQNSVRTLYDVSVRPWRRLIIMRFHGNGFLKQMVRNLVGTLLGGAQKELSPAQMYALMNAPTRSAQIITAPAEGLTLFRTCL